RLRPCVAVSAPSFVVTVHGRVRLGGREIRPGAFGEGSAARSPGNRLRLPPSPLGTRGRATTRRRRGSGGAAKSGSSTGSPPGSTFPCSSRRGSSERDGSDWGHVGRAPGEPVHTFPDLPWHGPPSGAGRAKEILAGVGAASESSEPSERSQRPAARSR